MQFFPVAEVFGSPVNSSAKGFYNENIYSYTPMNNGDSSFKNIFTKVSSYNDANTPGVPVTMRSTKDDNSYLKSDDFKFLKEKLTELGVAPTVIDDFFSQLSAETKYPNIGTLGSALIGMGKNERSTKAMTDQEMLAFRSLAEKLGFTQKEVVELEEKIALGNTLGVLKAFQEKMNGQEVTLDQNELGLLCRAADLDETQMRPVLVYWNQFAVEDKLIFTREIFDGMFGTIIAGLEQDRLQIQNLADNLGKAILSMLENKQTRNEGPVADNRGNALTERTETIARIIATSLKEEESEDEDDGTSHLIEDKKGDKLVNKQSTIAAILDKANKEVPRDMQETSLTGQKQNHEVLENNVRNAAFGAAANTSKNSAQPSQPAQPVTAQRGAQESILRAPAEAVFNNTSDSAEEKNGANTGKDAKSQQDFYSSSRQNADTTMSADKAALNAKVQEAPGVVFSMFGGTENSSQPGQAAQSAKTEIYHERIFDQIERGIIRSASDGSKQITIRLDPPELGKLILSLTVAQGEVKAVIRTDSSATTQVVSEQLAQLKQSLEEQGFKVSSLEVETRPQSHAGTDSWSGTEQHNQERELQEQQRFLRLSRTRAKEADNLAQSVQHSDQPASISASGIHIIA